MEEDREVSIHDKQYLRQLQTILHDMNRICNDIQTSNHITAVADIKTLLELQTSSNAIFSTNPILFNSLSNLETLLQIIEKSKTSYSLGSLFRRLIFRYRISQHARNISVEIQSVVDRETVRYLARTLRDDDEEDDKVRVLKDFTDRVTSRGFDRDFQDLILREKIFALVENIVCSSSSSTRVREKAAVVIDSLVKFNRNVFVGLVLMGSTVKELISIKTSCSIQILCSLIKVVKTPLVDEMEANGEIYRVISLLGSEDWSVRAAAFDCVLQLGFVGRREVVEEMIEEGLIEKLMELERLEVKENEGKVGEEIVFEKGVVRFAVEVEMGEGLERSERRGVKMEVLRRVRDASVSDAEAATIVAEVLWGSSS